MRLAPIVLFVYNRPDHTVRTIEALKRNELAKESELFIFSDGPKNLSCQDAVDQVRKVIHNVDGFKKVKVREREKNLGLAKSVISGVTEIINKYGKIIVLEDDLITAPKFLTYMNKLLDKYEKEKKIYSITGYNFPSKIMKIPQDYKFDVYFSQRAASWSWATWKDRWGSVDWEVKDFDNFKKDKDLQKKFNLGGGDMSEMLINQMEGKLDSWAIRWCYHHFKNEAFCVYPVKSFIDNIGHDGSGVHSGVDRQGKFRNQLMGEMMDFNFPEKAELNDEIMNRFRNIFARNKIYYLKMFIKKIIFYDKWKTKI